MGGEASGTETRACRVQPVPKQRMRRSPSRRSIAYADEPTDRQVADLADALRRHRFDEDAGAGRAAQELDLARRDERVQRCGDVVLGRAGLQLRRELRRRDATRRPIGEHPENGLAQRCRGRGRAGLDGGRRRGGHWCLCGRARCFRRRRRGGGWRRHLASRVGSGEQAGVTRLASSLSTCVRRGTSARGADKEGKQTNRGVAVCVYEQAVTPRRSV